MNPTVAREIPVLLEAEYIDGLKLIFEEKIVFNQVLGLKILDISPDRVRGLINMRPGLVGHFSHNRIHGGAISAGLDAMGCLAVMAAIGVRHLDEAPNLRLKRFDKLGTIDIRVDYLRPGIGESFELSAEVMRLGSRLASTRMEFLSAEGKLLSCGTATYIVS